MQTATSLAMTRRPLTSEQHQQAQKDYHAAIDPWIGMMAGIVPTGYIWADGHMTVKYSPEGQSVIDDCNSIIGLIRDRIFGADECQVSHGR